MDTMTQEHLDEAMREIRQIFDEALPPLRYQYYYSKGSNDRYFWYTTPVMHNGHKRYVSGIKKLIKARQVLRVTNVKYHAKRRDAKARALALYKAKGGN